MELVDSRPAPSIARLAIGNCVGFSATTFAPFWIGAIGPKFGLPVWQVGLIACLQLLAAAATNIATPILFRRFPIERLGAFGAGAACIGSLAAPLSVVAFFGGSLLTGLGLGLVLGANTALAARRAAVHSGYSALQFIELCFGIMAYVVAPMVTRDLGLPSLFMMAALLEAITFLSFVTLRTMPVSAPSMVERARGADHGLRPILILLAFALYFTAQSAIWQHMVAIGGLIGLDGVAVGRSMAFGVAGGCLGVLLARVMGERFGFAVPLLLSSLTLALGVWCLLRADGVIMFDVGAVLIEGATLFTVPNVLSLLVRFDRVGRWAAIGPASMLIGIALGPLLAALALGLGGYGAVGGLAAAMVLLAGTIFCLAGRAFNPSS